MAAPRLGPRVPNRGRSSGWDWAPPDARTAEGKGAPLCRSERKGPRGSYQPGSKTRHRLPAARPGAAAVSAAWGWGGEGRLGDPEVPVEGWVQERRLGAEPASWLRRRRCLVTLSPPNLFLLHCLHPQDVLPQPQVLLQGLVPQAWSAPSAESLGAGGGVLQGPAALPNSWWEAASPPPTTHPLENLGWRELG